MCHGRVLSRVQLLTIHANCGRTCIVVPAHNEANRFNRVAFVTYLQRRTDVNFVLVNDGSTDATLDIFKQTARTWPARVRVIDLAQRQGKAEAVRTGVSGAMSEGYKFVGYWDADGATPFASIDHFVDLISKHDELDIVLGTRIASLGRKIVRKPYRHYLGRVIATFASVVLDLPVYDTQCGAKLVRVSSVTQAVFAENFEAGWLFDVELIARYLKLTGDSKGLYEFVLDEWTDLGDSKVRALDFLRAFSQLAHIHRRYKVSKRLRRVSDASAR